MAASFALATAMVGSAAALSRVSAETKWTSLGLPEAMASRLSECGIVRATEIQREAIPVILEGADLVLHAETGSGKTYAYAIPLIATRRPTLVLGPSKALCRQIEKCWQRLGGTVASTVPDMIKDRGMLALTPRQVLGLEVSAAHLRGLCVVLDEADALLKPAAKYSRTKRRRMPPGEKAARILMGDANDSQLVAVSATVGRPLRRLLDSVRGKVSGDMIRVVRIVNTESQGRLVTAPRTLDHLILPFRDDGPESCVDALIDVLSLCADHRVLVALASLEVGQTIDKMRRFFPYATDLIYGDASSELLVADANTLRGLDIDLDIVVLFGKPNSPDDYVHIAGRTARNGQRGLAVTIAPYADARVIASWSTILCLNFTRLHDSSQLLEYLQSARESKDGGG